MLTAAEIPDQTSLAGSLQPEREDYCLGDKTAGLA